jgi:hypothetical protein
MKVHAARIRKCEARRTLVEHSAVVENDAGYVAFAVDGVKVRAGGGLVGLEVDGLTLELEPGNVRGNKRRGAAARRGVVQLRHCFLLFITSL